MSKLKPKSIQTLDEILKNPKLSNTENYLKTHPTSNRNSARSSVTELLAKPAAQIYLEEHISKAKHKVVQLIDSDKEEIALRASESVLDRELGKPTQRTEVSTTGITLNIDLTNTLLTDVAEQAQE
jgi:uncharacterized protein YccT (UPF0319 family)